MAARHAAGDTSGWLELFWFGRDFRIYRNAAVELLAGRSPFDAFASWNGVDWHFAAPPTAAQAFAPLTLVPEWLGLGIFTILSVGVVLLTCRRLGLAWCGSSSRRSGRASGR